MKRLQSPNMTYADVFDSCINSISDANMKTLFQNSRGFFLQANNAYNLLGVSKQLQNFRNEEYLVTHGLTHIHKEIIKLFEKFKSNKTKLPRINKSPYDFCNEIKNSSEQKCLYCSYGLSRTLDHYLPKSKFPLVCIEPANLIPCCYDCNTTLNHIDKEDNPLIIHPYFEHDADIYDKQWIHAKIPINQKFFTSKDFYGLAVEFYVDFSLTTLDETIQKRLDFQFRNLLKKKYVVESSAIISKELDMLRNNRALRLSRRNKDYLEMRRDVNRINSYEYVVYDALANSNDYLSIVENDFH